MTYENYIEETTNNCMSVLADCSSGQLLDVEYIRKILWEDDRVTGVYCGFCTSANSAATENIKEVLFDEQFLADFNDRNMNMQEVMANGADAIDVVARCLALKHISIKELVEQERQRRIKSQRESRSNFVRG